MLQYILLLRNNKYNVLLTNSTNGNISLLIQNSKNMEEVYDMLYFELWVKYSKSCTGGCASIQVINCFSLG